MPRIAIELDHGLHPKTAAALLRHGLIAGDEEMLPSWPTASLRVNYGRCIIPMTTTT
jgi:hypothetical protein